MEELVEVIKTQDETLLNDVNYDMVLDMNEQEINRLSLIKRMVNWLVPDVQENASTLDIVEVNENTQEENMDIEVLKDALSAVVDDKLANFATSIKEEVEASLNEKIDTITKGFEASTAELQEKLEAAEKALSETEEQVSKFADAGAIKKSVDPEDDAEDEELTKSATNSVWNNVYLPQSVINALGYES
jgi:LPS O-antigen subunit length determinant protein (WzzB/FepE family)